MPSIPINRDGVIRKFDIQLAKITQRKCDSKYLQPFQIEGAVIKKKDKISKRYDLKQLQPTPDSKKTTSKEQTKRKHRAARELHVYQHTDHKDIEAKVNPKSLDLVLTNEGTNHQNNSKEKLAELLQKEHPNMTMKQLITSGVFRFIRIDKTQNTQSKTMIKNYPTSVVSSQHQTNISSDSPLIAIVDHSLQKSHLSANGIEFPKNDVLYTYVS